MAAGKLNSRYVDALDVDEFELSRRQNPLVWVVGLLELQVTSLSFGQQ